MSFVNYTPSKERTDHNTNEAIMKYGKDIVIINGEDDWSACKLFKIAFLLKEFGIEKTGDFHDGVSGITKSGCIIKKSDLPIFIEKFNERKWNIRNLDRGQMAISERIKIFDPEVNEWKTFFKIEYGDTEYLKEKVNGVFNCRKKATCTVNNFEQVDLDVSVYFVSSKVEWYWKSKESF